MKLVFATNNNNKLKEARNVLNGKFEITGLEKIDCVIELPEPHPTLEENAKAKSFYIFSKHNVNCFADDTGLEIEALNGEPGVFSARYAGPGKSPDDNMDKVLEKMKGITNRKAKFRTIIHLQMNGIEKQFEGITSGVIAQTKKGEKGFGYDPIFIPEGYNISYAQMSLEEKNKISHRAKAIRELAGYLKNTIL